MCHVGKDPQILVLTRRKQDHSPDMTNEEENSDKRNISPAQHTETQ